MKLYQAVKQYGVKRVRLIAQPETDSLNQHSRLKPTTVRKIKEAYQKAIKFEQEILFYNPVSIAFYLQYALPAQKIVAEGNLERECKTDDCQELALYILESLEPENKFVQERKLWRKRYYSKK